MRAVQGTQPRRRALPHKNEIRDADRLSLAQPVTLGARLLYVVIYRTAALLDLPAVNQTIILRRHDVPARDRLRLISPAIHCCPQPFPPSTAVCSVKQPTRLSVSSLASSDLPPIVPEKRRLISREFVHTSRCRTGGAP